MSSDIRRQTSVDSLRRRIVEALLDDAAAELGAQLDATNTKFFSYNGIVTAERQVPDNAARLSAIDKVLSVAGLYMREAEPPRGRKIRLEYDDKTGVRSIIIEDGGSEAAAVPIVIESDPTPPTPTLPPSSRSDAPTSSREARSEPSRSAQPSREAKVPAKLIAIRGRLDQASFVESLFNEQEEAEDAPERIRVSNIQDSIKKLFPPDEPITPHKGSVE